MQTDEDESPEYTLADTIRRHLADDIIAGRVGVDQRLDETELASRFGVSRTPIRDALRQLAAIGMVQIKPRRSAVVAAVDPVAVGQAYEAAAEMEGVTAAWVATRATLPEKLELADLNKECHALVEMGDFDRFAAANRHFHDRIAVLARNESLMSATLFVRVQVAPFQRFQFESEEERRISSADHDLIVDRILKSDAEGARIAMREHILRSSANAVREIRRRYLTSK